MDTSDGSHNHIISVRMRLCTVHLPLKFALLYSVATMLLRQLISFPCCLIQVSTRQENSADSGADNVGKDVILMFLSTMKTSLVGQDRSSFSLYFFAC